MDAGCTMETLPHQASVTKHSSHTLKVNGRVDLCRIPARERDLRRVLCRAHVLHLFRSNIRHLH
jgi:hypothetical protein